MSSYKLFSKIIIYGKKKLIYTKKNSKKFYCKYKGSMITLSNYKKIYNSNKTKPTKTKITKTKSKTKLNKTKSKTKNITKTKSKTKPTKNKITKTKSKSKFFGGFFTTTCSPTMTCSNFANEVYGVDNGVQKNDYNGWTITCDANNTPIVTVSDKCQPFINSLSS